MPLTPFVERGNLVNKRPPVVQGEHDGPGVVRATEARPKECPMPTRTIVLTALIASCVSSLVTLAVALLVLAPAIRAEAGEPTVPTQAAATPGFGTPWPTSTPTPTSTTVPVVRANRFELVDQLGTVWVEMSMQPTGLPQITMFEHITNHPAVVIGLDPGQIPGIGVVDFPHHVSAGLGTSPWLTGLRIEDYDQGKRLIVGIDRDDDSQHTGLVAVDRTARAHLTVGPDGVVRAGPDGLVDDRWVPRLTVGLGDGGEPAIDIRNDQGESIWQAP